MLLRVITRLLSFGSILLFFVRHRLLFEEFFEQFFFKITPLRMPRLSRTFLVLSFLFVAFTFARFSFTTKKNNNNNKESIEDFAFTSQLFSGSWRNVVAFDSKMIRERKERDASVFHLGNADDAMRKRGGERGEEQVEEEEEGEERVPLLKTLAYEERR